MISSIAIIVLALVSIAFLVWLFNNHNVPHKPPEGGSTYYPTDDPKPDSNLIIHVGNQPAHAPESEPIPAPRYDLTLDEIYAESHNLWVCNYCETMNKNGSCRCIACGHEKNK